MSEPHCGRCKATDIPLLKNGGKHLICRPCNTARMKAYRQTDAGKKAVAAATKRYEAKNKIRVSSWHKASRIPILPCEVCATTEFVDRHHEDPAKPLEVIHLCRAHHKARHRELRAQYA